MQLQPNILFHDRYRLVELKGRGSFGEVWLARDEQLDDMEVAIKIYISLDVRGLQEFGAEYRNTYGLNHPNLLRAYHYEMCEDRPYLVMPYCPGSAINYIGHIEEKKLWQFIHDVASGLAYLHGKDIVHHDIKPDNILEDANGHFVISDFGISVKMRSTLRRNSNRQFSSSSPGGSIAYMGPEMFSSNAESVKATDIWALGATLYEMATGELPCFGQGGAMLLNGAEIERPQLPYSDSLVNTILECLAKETWDRPQAHQLVELANAALAGRPFNVNTPSSGNEEPRPQWHPQTTHNPHSTVHFGQGTHSPHEIMESDRHSNDPQTNAPVDNGGRIGGTIKEGHVSTPISVEKKKSKTWLWILLALLLVGGGFGGWKVIEKQKKDRLDNTIYAGCQKANDYRNYLHKFPEGRNVSKAQSQLDKMIADSIAQAKRQTEALARAEAQAQAEAIAQAEAEAKEGVDKKPEKKPDSEHKTQNNITNSSEKPKTPKNPKPVENDDIFSKPRKTTKEYPDGSVYEGYALPGSESKEGQGTLRDANGAVYSGNWKNNKRNGQGKQVFKDGTWYSGNWKDDKIEGYGEYHYTNGDYYKGHFKSGNPNGEGAMYNADGSIRESGYYVNGVKQ